MNSFSLSLYFKGILMGIADIVPGVSGGTIALVLGIYEKLIAEISHIRPSLLFKFQFKEFISLIDLKFLLTVFAGITSSILVLSRLIHFLLENYTGEIYSVFLGLILASVIIISKEYKLWKPYYLALMLLSALAIWFGLKSISFSLPETYPFIFLIGFIASSAMILPGISGSYLLVVFGMYKTIITHLKLLPALESTSVIAIFCIGVGLGILSMSKVLKKLFSWKPELVLSLLLGFVLGGFEKIWPWVKLNSEVESTIRLPLLKSDDLLLLLIVFISFATIISLDWYSKKYK